MQNRNMIIIGNITHPINQPNNNINLNIIMLLMNFVIIKQNLFTILQQKHIGGVDAIVGPVFVGFIMIQKNGLRIKGDQIVLLILGLK